MMDLEEYAESSGTVSAKLPLLLTTKDMTQLLHVHKRTIFRLCERNELPQPIKIGRSYRWRKEEVTNYLAGLLGVYTGR